MYQTIIQNSSYELTEKKSKFTAHLFFVRNRDEAENKIKELKKIYHDARHNCSAYRVIENEGIYEKSSDDGEPSGTAGAPILNILKKNNLCNVLVVVTRYFGGILLGTGGLVKCYSNSTIGAVNMSEIIKIKEGTEFEVEVDYNHLEAFKYYCKKNKINILSINYSEKILINIEMESNLTQKFLDEIENKKLEVVSAKEIQKKLIFSNV